MSTQALRLRVTRVTVPAWVQPLAVVGLVVVGAWLAIAALAPWLAPYDPLDQGGRLFQPPSAEHLFGTDDLGRDVFSRVLWGARVSIPLSVLLVTMAFLIGGTLGGLAAYLGGWVDELVMRSADLVFAIPTILLAMAVVALSVGSLLLWQEKRKTETERDRADANFQLARKAVGETVTAVAVSTSRKQV